MLMRIVQRMNGFNVKREQINGEGDMAGAAMRQRPTVTASLPACLVCHVNVKVKVKVNFVVILYTS